MAKISEYNVLFQDITIFKRRSVLNISDTKTKRRPFFLPQLKVKETEEKKCHKTDIELDVRGLGGKTSTDDKVFIKAGKRKKKNARQGKNKINSLSSPGNKLLDDKSRVFTLPPIDSKCLTQNPMEKTTSCSKTLHQGLELAFNTLINVIERSKEQTKRTAERFQGNIVHGEQKPINEKTHLIEKPKTGFSSM